MELPLYERVGGEEAILAAVDVLYEKLLSDPQIAPFFEGIEMQRQVKKLVAFMSYAFGGPLEYRGGNLRAAHAKLVAEKGLGDQHFDLVARHLEAALMEMGLPDDVVAEALGRVLSTRSEVLGR